MNKNQDVAQLLSENQYRYPALPLAVPNLKKIVIDVPTINSIAKDSSSYAINIKYPLNSKIRYIVVYSAKNVAQIDVNDPSQIIDKIAFQEKSDTISICIPQYKLDTNLTCAITFIDFYGNESVGTIFDLATQTKTN
jgi:hypothetical protein